MKQICFIILMMFLILSCKKKTPRAPNPYYPSSSHVKIWDAPFSDVERYKVEHKAHRLYIKFIHKEKANKVVKWIYYDPDDPASDPLIDPNNSFDNDNGYYGLYPANPPKFYDSQGREVTTTKTDSNGETFIWFEPSPDNKGWHHPGDNFQVGAIVEGDTFWSKPFFTYKRFNVLVDCIDSTNLISLVLFNSLNKTFFGIFLGDSCGADTFLPNKNSYVTMGDRKVHVINPGDLYYDTVITSLSGPQMRQEILNRRFYADTNRMDYADTSAGSLFPVYLLLTSVDEEPDSGVLGITDMDYKPGGKRSSAGSIVYVSKARRRLSRRGFNDAQIDTILVAIVAHELIHQITKMDHTEDSLHTRNDCIFLSRARELIYCNRRRLCSYGVKMLRGDIHKYGRPLF